MQRTTNNNINKRTDIYLIITYYFYIMSNDIQNFPIENLVISEIKNKKSPKLILANVPYPIGFETPIVMTPFGIDSAFGKFYIKLAFNCQLDNDFLQVLQSIEQKLMKLVPGLKSNFSNATTISCLLDRNVEITSGVNGKPVSMFAIQKGARFTATIELGDIYFNNTYKWIVRKIVVCTPPEENSSVPR